MYYGIGLEVIGLNLGNNHPKFKMSQGVSPNCIWRAVVVLVLVELFTPYCYYGFSLPGTNKRSHMWKMCLLVI